MSNNNTTLKNQSMPSGWITIQEAVKLANKLTSTIITESDIYRYALQGVIFLSIYFQSPIILRKVKVSGNRIILRPTKNSLIHQLCLLEHNCFMSGTNLLVCTYGNYIIPTQRIIDTLLTGYEYVAIQRLLAHSLNLPLPIIGANLVNYGVSVSLSGEIFQIFEKITWQERIKQQIMRLPDNLSPQTYERILSLDVNAYSHKHYFPLYYLPEDACFVLRTTELERLLAKLNRYKLPSSTSARISTPLSRLFWLACKHNETIGPLIHQPYKLLSIFEQWASSEGITDHLSGDTLKTALERGAPTKATVR